MLVEALKSFGSCVAFPAWHVDATFLVFGIALCVLGDFHPFVHQQISQEFSEYRIHIENR